MGMPFNQFIRHTVDHILQGEHPLFLRHAGMEYHLHQDIAQFLRHAMSILIIHCFQEFIAFFDQIGPDRIKILFPVPGAATRLAQHLHHIRKGTHIKLRFSGQKRKTLPMICLIRSICPRFIFHVHRHRLQSLLRPAGNKHAGQVIDGRLPVNFKERNYPAFLIFQPQVAEKKHFRLVWQDVHQSQFHIRCYHLVINLRNHKGILPCVCQSRKILCINDPQPVNGINFQIHVC